MTHTSGLRGTLPLRDAPDSATALRMVFTTTPVVAPGLRMVYSDLNAILLGEIVHRVSGQPLDVFVTREVYAPLGLDQQMMFRPRGANTSRVTNTSSGCPLTRCTISPRRI